MSIGKALSRVEGAQKIKGEARYSGDVRVNGMLYGVFVGAPVAAGKITAITTEQALRQSGVVRVLKRSDLPTLGKVSMPASVLNLPMQTDDIHHEGEAVAIVLGETLEAAEQGAALVRVEVQQSPPIVQGRGHIEAPPKEAVMMGDNLSKGDVAAALATAACRIEQTYLQPARHHNAMEPSSTLAEWSGDALTLHDSVQAAFNVPIVMSAAFGIPAANVRVVAPHTGGGFGSKGYVWPHQILAAAAARVMKRPVRITLTRSQMYSMVGYQPFMTQTVALGASADGKLVAIKYEATNTSALLETHFEPSSETVKGLYASPSIATKQSLERLSINVPTPMRAPLEGPGTWAVESAMDELAVALKIDPLDLRLINYAETDPKSGRPWSSKKLREAYERGAQLYGWRERSKLPKRDGDFIVGHGMATATMGSFRFPSVARVRLRDDGTAVIETGTHDIGTGTLTVFTQIAADTLGIDASKVSIRWGDTQLPPAGPVYGSSATMGTGSAVMLAARDARAKVEKLHRISGDFGSALRAAGVSEVIGEGRFTNPNNAPFSGDGEGTPHAMRTWGAVFVEVGVDPDFGLLRLRRVVGVYSAGRIINPMTARSQITGGMIWEWGKATMEESVQEPRYGRWLAKNLSNVAIPVNADIPTNLTVEFVDEFDQFASPVGARGIGELGATGMAAAVANAVYDAIGIRVRSLPILPWKLLDTESRMT